MYNSLTIPLSILTSLPQPFPLSISFFLCLLFIFLSLFLAVSISLTLPAVSFLSASLFLSLFLLLSACLRLYVSVSLSLSPFHFCFSLPLSPPPLSLSLFSPPPPFPNPAQPSQLKPTSVVTNTKRSLLFQVYSLLEQGGSDQRHSVDNKYLWENASPGSGRDACGLETNPSNASRFERSTPETHNHKNPPLSKYCIHVAEFC